MSKGVKQYIYGPVPSRRLGRSLGLDLVPFKTCTYDCIYCQLGCTTNKTMARKEYLSIGAVLKQLKAALEQGCKPDYISLAGSGEPTLNSGIGNLIAGIKRLTNIPVAVITNGSLLWMPEVQESLMGADLVLPSLDAGDARLFQKVNQPHKEIAFGKMVEGIAEFTKRYSGEVWLEILLCAGITGFPAQVKRIAALAKKIKPARVQLNTVVRPSAEQSALALSVEQMRSLKILFNGKVDVIAGKKCASGQMVKLRPSEKKDVLALLRRRPCTPKDVADGLGMHVHEAVKHLEVLAASGEIRAIVQGGLNFYAANDPQRSKQR